MTVEQFLDGIDRKQRIINSEGCNRDHSNSLTDDFRNFEIISRKKITDKDIEKFMAIKSPILMARFIDKIRRRWRQDTIYGNGRKPISIFKNSRPHAND